jgi:methylthioribose-1-phosphate isomerase
MNTDKSACIYLRLSAFTVANSMQAPRTIEWIGGIDGFVRLIDQTLLPTRVQYRDCRTVEEVWEAIKVLRVRGAPAIGVAAAMGVVVGMQRFTDRTRGAYAGKLHEVANYLRTSRPTAVNLFWALDRMENHVRGRTQEDRPERLTQMLLDEALAIEAEDRAMCRAIGKVGAALIAEGQGVLTHCNAGGLATADYGTALAVMFAAAEQGRRFHAYADETRPLLQGARLTAWELQQHGIDVTLICDNMAAQVMKEKRVHLVIVGADRIAANGDTANKIGTYGVALLAAAHDIPFYVAAPSSTFDLSLPDGSAIPIEQRDPREVTHGFGKQTAPEGVKVYNPAFDVTPHRLIAGIITEKGLIRPVNAETVRAMIR